MKVFITDFLICVVHTRAHAALVRTYVLNDGAWLITR